MNTRVYRPLRQCLGRCRACASCRAWRTFRRTPESGPQSTGAPRPLTSNLNLAGLLACHSDSRIHDYPEIPGGLSDSRALGSLFIRSIRLGRACQSASLSWPSTQALDSRGRLATDIDEQDHPIASNSVQRAFRVCSVLPSQLPARVRSLVWPWKRSPDAHVAGQPRPNRSMPGGIENSSDVLNNWIAVTGA